MPRMSLMSQIIAEQARANAVRAQQRRLEMYGPLIQPSTMRGTTVPRSQRIA